MLGVEHAVVTAISEEGLEIEIPIAGSRTRRGKVPPEEVFIDQSGASVLAGVASTDSVTIAVGDTIPVKQPTSSRQVYSRREAVVEAAKLVFKSTVVVATISETNDNGYIHALADDGYEVRLPLVETEEALEERFGKRRLRPGWSAEHRHRGGIPDESLLDLYREPKWLYAHDRIKVRVEPGKMVREGVFVGSIMVGNEPLTSQHRFTPSISESATAPETDFTEVVILHGSHAVVGNKLGGYFPQPVRWFSTLTELKGWLEETSRVHQRDDRPRPTTLFLVQLDTKSFSWETACQAITYHSTDSNIVLVSSPHADFDRHWKPQIDPRVKEFRLLGVWLESSGMQDLGALLQRRASKYGTPAPQTKTGVFERRSPQLVGAIVPYDEVAFARDCSYFLARLASAGSRNASLCTAFVFGIHVHTEDVRIEAWAGDKRTFQGFYRKLGTMGGSPIRDLAMFNTHSTIADARTEKRYERFVEAVGEPNRALPVFGIRLSHPPGDAYRHVLFLFARSDNPVYWGEEIGPEAELARRALEVALWAQRLNGQARQMERLAGRGGDARFACHEVKRYVVQSLGRDDQEEERASAQDSESWIRTHTEGVVEKLHCAEDVLNMFLKGTTDEPVDFPPLVAVREMVAATRDEKNWPDIRFVVPTPSFSDGLAVRSRRLSFECVLANVLINARHQIQEYCNGNGHVLITLSFDDDGKFLITDIVDDGPGIHRKYWDHIFDHGISTRKQGTGLGLAVARRMIADLGGKVELRDAPVYGGTCFRIHLPLLNLTAHS